MCDQCCQANDDPSGAVRRSPSIQTPLGHPEQARNSDIHSVPSGVTAAPSVPRLNTATAPAASGASPGASAFPSQTSAVTRSRVTSSASPVTASSSAAGSAVATISTGRSRGPRRSAPGANAAARDRDAGTHSRALPLSATSWASRLATAGSQAARTSEVNAFTDGPPSTIRKSGRLESRSADP